MDSEKIIKALELCLANDVCNSSCEICPYIDSRKSCMDDMLRDALSLIKELTEENRKLTEERDGFENLAHTAIETQNRMSDTIEQLTEENEKLSKTFNDLLKEAETYLKQREAFQSRVKYLEKENARLVEDNHILATEFKDKVKADTVRKIREELTEYLKSIREKRDMVMLPFTESVLIGLEYKFDQIANELLNESK